MSDGSSTISADLLAEWKHDLSCSSRTSQGYSLQTVGKLWPESFMDWPASGTTSDGGLFQQPPLELRISETAGGDLLGTPRAINLPPAVHHLAAGGSHKWKLENQVHLLNKSLPTPTAHDAKENASPSRANRKSPGIGAIAMLLPTPRAQNGEDRNNKIYPRPLDQPQNLENALARLPNDSDPTQEQSADGSVSWEEPHLIPPSTDD